MTKTISTPKQAVTERRTQPDFAISGGRMKHCDRHDGLAVPEGGVDLGARWICAKCWLEVQAGRQLRSINQERSKKRPESHGREGARRQLVGG